MLYVWQYQLNGRCVRRATIQPILIKVLLAAQRFVIFISLLSDFYLLLYATSLVGAYVGAQDPHCMNPTIKGKLKY